MSEIADRLDTVRARIRRAEHEFARTPGSVKLLAVSKTKPAEALRAAYAAGQRCFGENYAQEAEKKMRALADLQLEWHFIGPIQSNKTRLIATHFDWVHSVDREKIAHRLSEQRPSGLPPLNLCVQVNVSGEESKSGVMLDALGKLVADLTCLPGLRVRGLMAIPAPTPDFAEQRKLFRVLREMFEELNAQGLRLDTLSMGMSDDLEAAVAEGATWVRIGTAIFGPRERSSEPSRTIETS